VIIIKIKLKLRRLISYLLAGVLVGGVAYAAISNKIFMKGTSFSTSTVQLKFLKNLSQDLSTANLTSELIGISFEGILNGWQQDYPVKITNTSTKNMNVWTYANYQTDQDPASLRYSLYVELLPWNDLNNDGVVDSGEEGASLGKKSFVKWKTEGFDLGSLEGNKAYGYILRFSSLDITDAKQGASGIFDFEFGVLQ
jgi:hypothetical protein